MVWIVVIIIVLLALKKSQETIEALPPASAAIKVATLGVSRDINAVIPDTDHTTTPGGVNAIISTELQETLDIRTEQIRKYGYVLSGEETEVEKISAEKAQLEKISTETAEQKKITAERAEGIKISAERAPGLNEISAERAELNKILLERAEQIKKYGYVL